MNNYFFNGKTSEVLIHILNGKNRYKQLIDLGFSEMFLRLKIPKLVRKGYLSKTKDKRFVNLYLTDKGLEIAQILEKIYKL